MMGLLLAMTHSALMARPYAPDTLLTFKTIGDITLQLHVFYPEGHTSADHRPAIVFFHGGGWNNGSPSSFYPHAHYLASRGMVAISAEYRLRDTHGTSPRKVVFDGKSAMRWIREHASELGINPDMLAAGGGSAGGHIAAAVATLPLFNDPRDNLSISTVPQALVLFNPVFDNGPDGYGHDRVREYWEHFSPLHNIGPDIPPTLVMLGTEDHLVPVATAEAFRDRMVAYGVKSELILYDGAQHGFYHYHRREYYLATVAEMDRFLTAVGFLPQQEDD